MGDKITSWVTPAVPHYSFLFVWISFYFFVRPVNFILIFSGLKKYCVFRLRLAQEEKNPCLYSLNIQQQSLPRTTEVTANRSVVVCVLLLRCFWWQPNLLCLNIPSVSFTENHPPPIITQPLWWLCDSPAQWSQTRWYHFFSCFSLHEIHYQPLSSDSKQNTSPRFRHNLKKRRAALVR